MRYCKRCLEPDTRPDCIFDDEGICYPCRYHERMDEIDWAGRHRELEEIAAWAKQTNVSGYDCIIPVSGGKDSHRQALYARDVLGLRPLLVTLAYPPEQQSERGAHNMANLIKLGFDSYVVSPGPETWRQMLRFGFMKFANHLKPSELALYATVPKFAIMFRIPLVIYGENPALSWGSSGGSMDGNANRLKYTNTLRGGDLSPYLEAGFERKELYWYSFPSDDMIDRAGLRMIYLGYFIRDFNDYENARIAMENGLECRTGEDARPEDIGDLNHWDQLDTDHVTVNQMIKYLKFGFGKSSQQGSCAIRNGIMSREQAVELVSAVDGRCHERYVRMVADYLGITEQEFWEVADSVRNPDIWERQGNEWRHKFPLKPGTDG